MIRKIRAGKQVHLCDNLFASGKIDNNKFNITISDCGQPAVQMVGAKDHNIAKEEIYKALKNLESDYFIGDLEPNLPDGSILCDIILLPKDHRILNVLNLDFVTISSAARTLSCAIFIENEN